MTERGVVDLIRNDEWMMEILKLVQSLRLPDWWIGAGFVRSKVWDVQHGYQTRTPLPDIDVIYFDPTDFSKEELNKETTKSEKKYQNYLKTLRPDIVWSVTNQARMHVFHNDSPYKSSEEALSKWIETATCVGVRLENNGDLRLVAPHGIDDLVNLIVRPTLSDHDNIRLFRKRLREKQWLLKWPKLRVIEN